MFNPLTKLWNRDSWHGPVAGLPARALTALWGVSLLLSVVQTGVAATTEDESLRNLASATSPAQKDAACASLKRVATPKSVPALSPLLLDEQLSHSARYVLETLPGPEASRALLEALDHSDGLVRIGLIQSLGIRRDPTAIPRLQELARSTNAPITAAVAAIASIGEIGGTQSAEILLKFLQQPQSPKLRTATIDAALRAANGLISTNTQSPVARSLFQVVYESASIAAHAKAGAFRGLVLCVPDHEGLAMLKRAFLGQDAPTLYAALQLVPGCKDPGATEVFASLLPGLQGQSRASLIRALQQRCDPLAARTIIPFLQDADSQVRASAIAALGVLGDSPAALALAEFAAKSSGAEQTAAREALGIIPHESTDAALLGHLGRTAPAVQSEIAKALGQRGYAPAVPALIRLARLPTDPPSGAALQALAALVNPEQLGELIGLVAQAADEPTRTRAAEALNSAYQRLLARDGVVPTRPLALALASASPEAQRALLFVCAGLPGQEVHALLRSAAANSDERIRDAGIRAMCESRDPELFPDLVAIACEAREKTHRTLALTACSRFLATDEARLPSTRKLQAIHSILARDLSPGDKKLLLAGLAEMRGKEPLAIATKLGQDAAVKAEAGRAVLKISASLPPEDAPEATTALERLEATADDALRKEASALLQQIYSRMDYLTQWQVSGPYFEPGKNFAALFDIPFPPETSDPSQSTWQLLPGGTDPNRPIVVDLLKTLGGEQCVAYVRTWVRAEHLTPCVLELGSDDGAKVWLNGKLIHANNTARPVQCGSDKINAELKPGWNLLLMKITQNNLGWEFCARCVKPDGSRLKGLKLSSTAPETD